MIEKQRRHTQLLRFELIKDVMRIVGAVIVPYSGMIAPDDEMRATIVLSDQRVKDCPAWPRIAHRPGQADKNRDRRWLLTVEYRLVGVHPHNRGEIVGFSLTDERM